jgi:hypothetical protein
MPVTATKSPGVLMVMVAFCVKSIPDATPFLIVARTITVPTVVVVKVLPLIVAPVSPALATAHMIVRFVALGGVTVPLSVVAPTVPVVGISVIVTTGICNEDEIESSSQETKTKPRAKKQANSTRIIFCSFITISLY